MLLTKTDSLGAESASLELINRLRTIINGLQRRPVEFEIREGFFKSPYVSQLRPTTWEAIDAIDTKARTDKIKEENLQKAREALQWRQQLQSPKPSSNSSESPKIVKYQNGQSRSVEPQQNGKNHGVAKYWHENGKLYAEIPWENGEKHGSFKLYRPDGSLESEFMYKNGKMHGLQLWFDTKMNLTHEELHFEGTLLPLTRDELKALKPDPN